jgi:hypothetical protein
MAAMVVRGRRKQSRSGRREIMFQSRKRASDAMDVAQMRSVLKYGDHATINANATSGSCMRRKFTLEADGCNDFQRQVSFRGPFKAPIPTVPKYLVLAATCPHADIRAL